MGAIVKIKSRRKFDELMDVLENPHPGRYQRLWLVGFLRYVGYSDEEIFEIIDIYRNWDDYSPEITKYNIRSTTVKKGGEDSQTFFSLSSSQSLSFDVWLERHGQDKDGFSGKKISELSDEGQTHAYHYWCAKRYTKSVTLQLPIGQGVV